MATVYGVTYDSFSMHDEVQRTLRQQLDAILEKLQAGEPAKERGGKHGRDGRDAKDEQNERRRREAPDSRQGREALKNQHGCQTRVSSEGQADRGSRNALALAGTSLGAYWAARLGNHFGIPAVLINPTIHPHQSLKRYVGHKLLNFVTRSRNILRDEVPASYGDIERSGDFLVLLDKGDELLDYRQAEKWFDSGKNSGNSDPVLPETTALVLPETTALEEPEGTAPETARRDSCKVITFEGGSHRFSHMEEALPQIRQFLSRYFASRQHSSGPP